VAADPRPSAVERELPTGEARDLLALTRELAREELAGLVGRKLAIDG
jgi:hypothetical protein